MIYKHTKLILIALLFWLGVGNSSLRAQQYAQVTRDFECKVRENGRKIQLFKGEIYEIFQDEKNAKLTKNKKGIIVKINNITIEIPWGSGTKQTYRYPATFNADSFKIIQDKNSQYLTRSNKTGKYRFNISDLQINDTIFFASYSSKSVVKLLNTKSIETDSSYFEKNYYGQVVRMIVPNFPTLGFEWNEINVSLAEQNNETPSESNDLDGEETAPETEASSESGSFSQNKTLILIIAFLALVGIIFIVFRGRLFGEKEKKNIAKNTPKRHNEIKRRRSIIRDEPAPEIPEKEIPVSENNTKEEETEIPEKTEIIAEKAPETEEEKTSEPEPEPEEDKIIIEREEPVYKPENQIIVKETSPEDLEKIKELENKLSSLESEKENLEKRLQETEEKPEPETVISSENTIIGIEGIDIGNYAYLCEWFKNYLEKAEYVETKVKEFHDRSIKEDAQTEKAVIEGVLYKFYTAKNGISAFDYWKLIIQELENTNGKIIESRLKEELKNIAESERVTYLQNRLFKEVLAGYFGATLIMCEEMRNIDRFTNLKFLLAENISEYFAKESETLVQAFSGSVSRRVNYVPLFEVYKAKEDIKISQISADNFAKPAFYEEMKAEEGEIMAIKTYGFGETPSEILIA